ncbi:hypothetical protein AX17_005978 [Amanita inopinata Kibby_2008]|nr:hypothetical protein AX17_005978 [Amanita inopinata Kibby_2008]
MFKLLFLTSLLSSSVLAQSSSSSTTDPLIPSGISPGCSAFLTSLNGDSAISACTSSLINSTKQFGPGGNATSASSSDVNSAINAICSSSTDNVCPESTIRGKLAAFYSACSAELTINSVPGVNQIYDVLYTLLPFKKAICSKNDNDNYCILQQKNSATPSGLHNAIAVPASSNPQDVMNHLSIKVPLQRRGNIEAVAPNVTTFRNTNLPFLFLKPDLDAATLCTSCTRQIFMSYFNFETVSPYAPGLTKSTLLGGQLDLYKGIQNTCGQNFLQTNVQAAGGISGDSLFSGAAHTANSGNWVITMVLGVAMLVVTSIF